MKINHDITRKGSISKTINLWLHQRSFIDYVRNRIQWYYYPQLSILKKYPIHIDIELSSYCQLECPMCFRFHRPIEHQGNMKFETFKKIIDEISGRVYSIKFTGRGEPLINKKFPKFMEYLKDKKFGEIAIITNGQLMQEESMRSMIDDGMDRVAFSIDGLKKEYENIRKPIKYEEILGIVNKLYNLRKSKGARKPLIRIQAIKTTIDREKKFLSTWEDISDEIFFLEYKDYSANATGKEQTTYRCPSLYQRMMIHWDGTVPMCINDEYEEGVVGNILEESVSDVWNGERFQRARNIHKKGLRGKAYKNCARCALHRKGHGKTPLVSKISNILKKKRNRLKLTRTLPVMKETNYKILAFILARGGSTGVPNKNIKLINGKALIGYTIEIAKASKYINRIIVATDNPAISKISKNYGAEVPFMRPAEMSQKLSRAYDVYRHFTQKLKDEEQYRPDIFVCLFSTSYTKTIKEVDAAIEKLILTKCDWVFTVTECEHHPYRFFVPVDDDRMANFCKDVKSYDIWGNRQELPVAYRINGNAFVTWTENIENFTTYNVDMVDYPNTDARYIMCPQEHSMDIDTPFDFEIAEFVSSKLDITK